jgi:nuclear transport factor 2 (NTF2) superfamily protein
MNHAKLTDFAERYAAAWSSRDPDRLAAFYSETGTLQVNGGAPAIGRGAVRAAVESFMTAFPDMCVELDSVTLSVAGARFAWIWTGTNTGPGGTGKSVRMVGYEDWTFADESHLSQSLGHFDDAEYQRQVRDGVQPA